MTTQKEQIDVTNQKIVDALVKIGMNKKLDDITVSQIVKVAGISRGTFYLHYLDKKELVVKLRGDIIFEVHHILSREMSQTMNRWWFDSRHEPYPVITDILSFAADNKKLLKFLLGTNGDTKLYRDINDELEASIIEELSSIKMTTKFRSGIPRRYAIKVIVSGIMTVITTWIVEDDSLSVEEVSKLIMNLLFLSPYEMLGIKR